VLNAAGFALLAFTWGRVAGLTDVAFQLPYLVSGGFTGTGLVLVGLTTIAIGSRRREAAERARQMERLAALVREAAEMLSSRQEPPAPKRRAR
jgi:hypothetical protein